MKRSQIIFIAIVAMFVVFVFGSQLFSTTETYVNETKEVIVEVETEVDSIEKRISDAQAEAMADIEAEANKMRDQFIQNELKTVEAEVLAEIEAELKQRRTDVEKQTGAYWRDVENVKALIKATFHEEPHLAVQVFWQESNLRMEQSKLRYTAKNVPPGFKVGDLEQSFCFAQIHEPAHKHTIAKHGLEDFKTNVESCVKIARVVYDQAGGSFSPWTEYHKIMAMR